METQERLRRIDPARLTAFQAELLRKEYSVGTAENYLRAVRAFARWSGGEVERGLVLTWKAQLTARYPCHRQCHAGRYQPLFRLYGLAGM